MSSGSGANLRPDSAELEAVANELSAAREALSEFALAAAHDLSRPASQIRALISLFVESAPDGLDRELIENIQVAADRLNTDVKGLAAYAEAVATPYCFETADVSGLIRVVLSRCFDAPIRAGQLVIEYGELPRVRCDRSRLSKLFEHLIDNSLKFRRGDQAHVSVSAVSVGRFWEFSVQDRGLGIDAAYRERVFLPFRRLFPDKYPGTGMGLAICRRVVEMHGGRMWLAEGASGLGADFRFTLPG